jgi:hypothetical protein
MQPGRERVVIWKILALPTFSAIVNSLPGLIRIDPQRRTYYEALSRLLPPIAQLLGIFVCATHACGAISALNSPADIPNRITVSFDGYPDGTVANTLFQSQGVTFTRDDGLNIYLMDWTAAGRLTTSPDDVLATIRTFEPTWATHLNVTSAFPLYATGAYFGNDQSAVDFARIRMSAYGSAGELLGFVEVTANNNTHVDQFIGLRSDIPFSRIRFENLNAAGTPSESYSVVIDDLVFALFDSDHDGVPDASDECPNSPLGAIVNVQGCSIEELCPCEGPWRNHGEFVNCMRVVLDDFSQAGLITAEQRRQLFRAAAESDCGKGPRR